MQPSPGTQGDNECDSNADTCCLEKNWLIMEYTRRTADVYSYDSSAAPIADVPIVTGATAWDDPHSGETYIFIINEALYYGSRLDHSLINPNQIRDYGIGFWDNPYDPDRDLFIEVNEDLKIEMFTKGTKVIFRTRVPTEDELANYQHVILTSKKEWNPTSVKMAMI